MGNEHDINIHIFVHQEGETPQNPSLQRDQIEARPQRPSARKRAPREMVDIKTSMARTFWSKNLHRIFELDFMTWYNLQGTWADRSRGGSNDGTHLETADHNEEFRQKSASAKGLHIPKEILVDEMVKCGLLLARENNYERATMEQYMETKAQLVAEGYGLNEEHAAQLKSRVYQGRMQIAS